MAKALRTVGGGVLDPTIQFATLMVDGKEYQLAYSFNAIAAAERTAGCNLLSGLESLNDLTALQLRGLLFAALSIAHPTVKEGEKERLFTVEDAGRMIRLDTIAPITTSLAEAYQLSMPEKKKDPIVAGAPPA
jgi:hypothetical protein